VFEQRLTTTLDSLWERWTRLHASDQV
jgi:hypothetical protein